MNLRAACAAAIRRCGGRATVWRAGEAFTVDAALQPRGLPGEVAHTAAGAREEGRYLLYLPAGAGEGLGEGDRLRYGGRGYFLRGIQPVLAGGEVVYWRALLQGEEE